METKLRMKGKRNLLFAIIASVVLIVAFSGLIWVDVESSQRISSLQASVSSLDNRVSALENMTWHVDGNYTLSQSNPTATVNTQGKAWRLTYVYNGVSVEETQIVYNLQVKDSSGNIVGGLDGIELTALANGGKGTLYIPETQGTYTVQMTGVTGGYTFAFQVESYY